MSKQRQYTLITFQGRQYCRIFETEVHKKKFLDAWKDGMEKENEKYSVYAYCILDDKAVFLTVQEENARIDEKMKQIWEGYREKMQEIGFPDRNVREVLVTKEFIERMEDDQNMILKIKDSVIRIHFLPVKENYVIWPENYWWSSYLEYLGRNWMPFQIKEILDRISKDERKIRREVKKYHREWKKQYLSMYL